MRKWSFHPKYLDIKGLVDLRREALLTKHVQKREKLCHCADTQDVFIETESHKNPAYGILSVLQRAEN